MSHTMGRFAMFTFKGFLGAVIFSCYLFLFNIVNVNAANNSSWAKPGENVVDNYLLIKIAEQHAPLIIEYTDAVPTSGISTLNEVIVKFGVFKIEQRHRIMQKNLSNPYASHLTRWYTVYFPEDSYIFAIKQALEQVSELEFVEFRSKPKLRYRPNDPVYDDQWHLPYCGFDVAWDFTKGSKDVVIGIVDSGIDISVRNNGVYTVHEDLEANLWFNLGEDADGDGQYTPDDWNRQDDDENGYVDDFFGWDVTGDDNCPDDIWARMYSHGTLVAGTASGVSDNEIGIASGGFNCSLMNIACYDPEFSMMMGENVYGGVLYCAQMGADVISLSWGGYEEFSEHDNEIIQFANEQGSIVIGAAGNDNVEYNFGEEITDYPIGYEGVIGVGSITNEDVRTDWSNWGNSVDIVAPGEVIYTCEPGNEYGEFSGNSAATPVVAGLAGLLLSVMPDLNSEQLL